MDIEPLLDSLSLRAVFGRFPTGVVALCSLADEGPIGMAASSFTAVSMDPPLVSVCVQNTSATWPSLRRSPRLGISVLAEEHDDVCQRLAMKLGDRFAGTSWKAEGDGSVYIGGAAAWLSCSLHAEAPAGDHTIALLEIHGVAVDTSVAPLVFHSSAFRRLAV